MFEKFAAIYTVYHPDKGFFDRISPVVSNCAIAIVIDNTPGGADLRSPSSNIIVLSDGINKGLGKALNIGLKEANFRKCDAVVLFDQDSTPDEKFITALKMGLNTAGVGGIVGPKLIDDSECENVESFSNCGVEDVENFEKISCLATSGMCFGLEALNTGNWFSEDFFLDFVDFDWCWRMSSVGWKIYKINSLLMPHRLGISQRKVLGLVYHVPADFRHYFQFRDTLKLMSKKYVPFYSKFRLFSILIPKILVYPFILDKGFSRLSWMLLGIVDAFRGISGAGAASKRIQ